MISKNFITPTIPHVEMSIDHPRSESTPHRLLLFLICVTNATSGLLSQENEIAWSNSTTSPLPYDNWRLFKEEEHEDLTQLYLEAGVRYSNSGR